MKPMGMYAGDGIRIITPYSQKRDLYRTALFGFVLDDRTARGSGKPTDPERAISFVHGACRFECTYSRWHGRFPADSCAQKSA
ncbi:hypothetical protein BJX66DRAFT_296300 [Aspergillus keveii]|uniref:Uncharacterized protein n=1 Tax=Aspergillus keveii TaxID=714993 RepID=A0ABR4GG69_9EURO